MDKIGLQKTYFCSTLVPGSQVLFRGSVGDYTWVPLGILHECRIKSSDHKAVIV